MTMTYRNMFAYGSIKKVTNIDFPHWVKTTPCEEFTRGVIIRTQHGVVHSERHFPVSMWNYAHISNVVGRKTR